MISRVPLGALAIACWLVYLPLLAQQAAPAQTEPRADIPFPRTGDLEPAVAEQLEAARRLFEIALPRTLEARERARLYASLAQLYHAYDLLEPAEIAYRQAVRLAPEDRRWPHLLGWLLLGEGRYEAAAASLDRALALGGDNVAARIYRAQAARALGQPEEAESHLLAALEADPESAAALADLGQLSLSRRDYAAAAAALERALTLLPEADRLHYPLAMAYRGLGEEPSARRHLELVGTVGARPSDPLLDQLGGLRRGERVRLLRGQLAFAAGRYEEAVALFRLAVDAAPESARARVNLASALGETGRTEQAIAELRRALELDPQSATAHYNLAVLLLRRGDHNEALVSISRAVELEPQDRAALLIKADVLRALGRPEEALAEVAAAIALEPRDPEARLREAELLVDLERYREAREKLEGALALFPTDGQLARALARLLAASPDREVRDGAHALELAQQVFAARGNAGDAETMAMALAELGRCTEAAEWQRQAIELASSASERSRLHGNLAWYEARDPCRQ